MDLDRYGIHEFGGPRLIGGVSFLTMQTALFCDKTLRRFLNSDERVRALLELREETFRLAATELLSTFSPVDLLLFTHDDREQYQSQCFEYIMMCHERNHRSIIAHDGSNGTGFDNIAAICYLSDNHTRSYMATKRAFAQRLQEVQRYFAYRKGLLKLDFIQTNSDPEDVLKILKSSTRWSELGNYKLRLGLESHMNLLKEYEMSESSSGISKCKSVALENINFNLSSELYDYRQCQSDLKLMNQYYNRKLLRKLARECAIQAQSTGFILVEEALPVHSMERGANLEVKKLPSIKQTVKWTLEGCMASLHRVNERIGRGATRGKAWQLVAFSSLATYAATGWMSKR